MRSFRRDCLFILLITGILQGIQSIEENDEDCVYYDSICLNSWDVANYEAIRTLHAHLDDDGNGDIDFSESVEFLREELNYTKEVEKRQHFFHPNNDDHISVKELWTMWINSEVHNWTVENTVSWLCLSVDLVKYAEVFAENAINGSYLPRLATNNDQFLTRTLGIKNPAHRSKIAIKAMDVVLFGPPKDTGSYLKDITIVLLITFLVIGAFRFYHVQKDFDRQRSRMVDEMDALNAEERKFREEVQLRRDSLEIKQVHNDCSSNDLVTEVSQSESSAVKWEDDSECAATTEISSALQMWLQLTYEREKAAFDSKCQLVEAQLREAKEMCEKLHPSKKQFFASLGLVHGKTEPKYDAITEAVRDSIAEIKLMHKETEYRWNAIEKWMGCEITTNAGLTHLEFLLEPEIHCQSKATSSTVVHRLLRSQSALIFLTLGGYSGLGQASFGLKGSNFGQRKRKKDRRSSPETASIRSTSSLPTHDTYISVGGLQQSQTIATALGNIGNEDADNAKEPKPFTDSPKLNHLPIGNSSTINGSNPQLLSEPKKESQCVETTEEADSNTTANSSTLPQVRSRIKPFIKSYSQDATEEWPKIVGGKNDSKFKSEPSLETDGNVVSETSNKPIVNGGELRRSKRKFFRSKIFHKLMAKTDKTPKIKKNT